MKFSKILFKPYSPGGSATIDHHPASRRGHLDKKLIVATAREIIQREGLRALTLRHLGETLHVDATAMYRHFSNKSALLTALFGELFEELEAPDPLQPWRQNLTQLMHAWWNIYRDNREVAAKLTKSPNADPGRSMLTGWVATELARAGIPQERLEQYQQVICAHVMGHGLLNASQEPPPQAAEQTFTLSVDLLLGSIEELAAHRETTE